MQLELLPCFQVHKPRGAIGKGKVHFGLGFEQMEDHHLVLVVAQVLQRADQGLGVFGPVEHVAEDQDEGPSRRGFCDLVEGLDGTCGPRTCGRRKEPFQLVEEHPVVRP